jgi:hypothetical protein
VEDNTSANTDSNFIHILTYIYIYIYIHTHTHTHDMGSCSPNIARGTKHTVEVYLYQQLEGINTSINLVNISITINTKLNLRLNVNTRKPKYKDDLKVCEYLLSKYHKQTHIHKHASHGNLTPNINKGAYH